MGLTSNQGRLVALAVFAPGFGRACCGVAVAGCAVVMACAPPLPVAPTDAAALRGADGNGGSGIQGRAARPRRNASLDVAVSHQHATRGVTSNHGRDPRPQDCGTILARPPRRRAAKTYEKNFWEVKSRPADAVGHGRADPLSNSLC